MANRFEKQLFAPFNWDALLKNVPVSSATRKHLGQVYLACAASSAIFALGSYLTIIIPSLASGLWMIPALLCMFGVYVTAARGADDKALYCLAGFALSQGLALGHAMQYFTEELGIESVFFAAVTTASLFAAFSGFAMLSERRSLIYLGGLAYGALHMIGLLRIFTWFVPAVSTFYWDTNLILGTIVFILYIIADTQAIIEESESGNRSVAMHTLKLFLDLLNLFVRVLAFLNKKAKKENKK